VASYVIKVHDLIGSFLTVPTGQKRETVAGVPHGSSRCWDHRSEKVTEHHSCQSSHVNGAIELKCWCYSFLFISILPWCKLWQKFFSKDCWCQSCCLLFVAILPWSKLWQKLFSDPLHRTWDTIAWRRHVNAICYDNILAIWRR